MKSILLISNPLFHYRVSIYNYFWEKFQDIDIDLQVLTNQIKPDNPHEIRFKVYREKFSLIQYTSIINEVKPKVIIFFMHLKDWVHLPLLLWSKMKGYKCIYWTHGANLLDSNNKPKEFLFSIFHYLYDAIILYSANEKKYIKNCYRRKVFIANNALNFSDFPKIHASKTKLKKINNYSELKIVLFVSRIQPIKRLGDLVGAADCLDSGIIILIVGPGISRKQQQQIENKENVVYLGPVYDPVKISKLFKMADLFCIPGAIGLSLNQAFYWGLPIITMDVIHGPEIVYLKNEKNGFIVPRGDIQQLAGKINYILSDKRVYSSFSKAAREEIMANGTIDNMFQGFKEALKYIRAIN